MPSRVFFLAAYANLATLGNLVDAIYDKRATVFRCVGILQVEEDAGTANDATMDAANRVMIMALYSMGDAGWDLKAAAQKKPKPTAKSQAAPTNQVVMPDQAQVGPSAQGLKVHAGAGA